MAEYYPDMSLVVAPMPQADGVQISPPIVYQTLAEAANAQSGASIDGRYDAATGEAKSVGHPLLKDTYKAGGTGTGTAFTVVTGTWRDDWYSADTNKMGLMLTEGASAAQWEVLETATGTKLTSRRVIIGRGTALDASALSPTTMYCYLEFASGSSLGNYRLAFEWGNPVALDYSEPGSATWSRVAIARQLGNAEDLFGSSRRAVITIEPDNARNLMRVDVSGQAMRHSPNRGDRISVLLPYAERYRFYGKNGWASLEVLPLRYQPVTVTTAKRNLGNATGTIAGAGVTGNGFGTTAAQTVEGTGAIDGDNRLQASLTATAPDDGLGNGSEYPATLSDVTVWIPAQWSTNSPWQPMPSAYPRCMHVHEIQVWDDMARFSHKQAHITISNKYGDMTGAWGQYAAILRGSNGYYTTQRMRGVLGGDQGFINQRTGGRDRRTTTVTLDDFSYKMRVPIAEDIVLDGWCLWGAVRMLCELGQIHPQFLLNVPYWPYGPADATCPFPILPRGSGLNPKYRFGPARSAMSVLLELIQDAGAITADGTNNPYMMGFDEMGQFRFQPVDPRFQAVRWYYDDEDTTGLHTMSHIMVYNSVEQMRTSLDLQGQDAYTNELMMLHLDLPWNLPWVGYRFPWVERNSRWASEQYLFDLGRSASVLASMPTQVIQLRTTFNPLVQAGDLIYVSERHALGRAGFFVVTVLESGYGLHDTGGYNGQMECWSAITARAAEQLIPF